MEESATAAMSYVRSRARLLGLDPVALAGVQARVASTVDGIAAASSEGPDLDASLLPATGGLLTEILGQHHGGRDARLFVA